MIYEFGVSPDNTSFKDSPDIVLKSLAQLTYFGQRAVASSQKIFSSQQWEKLEGSTIMDPWVPPNELLALAYMEDDSISVSNRVYIYRVKSHINIHDYSDSTTTMAKINSMV